MITLTVIALVVMAREGKSTPSEYQHLSYVDEQVIKDIVAWILRD